MHPWRSPLSALLALFVMAAPVPGQPADSVRLDIERAVLRELLTSNRHQMLRRASHANYVCLARRGEDGRGPPPEALITSFEDNSPPIVSVSECRVMNAVEFSEADPEPETSTHHRGDGAPAVLYWIGPLEWVRGDSASVRAGYLVHPRHGAQYECDVRRDGNPWAADCAVRSVS